MAKLIVAHLLLFGGANAMGIYGGEKNGCGEPCKAVVTLNTEPGPFDPIESGTCYVVDGTFPEGSLFISPFVPDGANCAKITVPSGRAANASAKMPNE